MHFDEVLVKLGEFGKYQKIQFLLICLPMFVSSWLLFSVVFVMTDQRFYCAVPQINDTWLQSHNITRDSYIHLLSSPENRCRQHTTDEFLLPSPDDLRNHYNNNTSQCTRRYIYDDLQPRYTMTMQFDLVCQKEKFVSKIKSVFMSGRIFGCAIFGQISDRFGRRFGFFLSLLCVMITGSILCLSVNVWMFISFYFLLTVSQAGIYASGFIIVMEIIGPSYRMIFGFILHSVFSFAAIVLAGISYFVTEWHQLMLLISLMPLAFIPYWWFLPESVRWLTTQNRQGQVKKLLEKIARMNGTHIPSDFTAITQSPEDKNVKTYTIVDLLNKRKIAIISLITWFTWMVNGLLYYGLSINSVNYDGNIYINFSLSALVEIPAYLLCIPMLAKLGRKKILCFFMLFGGATCIASSLIPKHLSVLAHVLATTGKFGATAAIGIVYIYTAELFPTAVRNLAIGTASIFGSIGGAISPLVLDVPGAWPLIIYGFMSIASGVFCLLLTETKGLTMPDTISEVVTYNRNNDDAIKVISRTNESADDTAEIELVQNTLIDRERLS
ncbi:organic cation transporter protein-like [Argonauta hians]